MACKVDCKKWGVSAIVAIVALNVMEFVLHGKLLSGVYMRPSYMRLWNPQEVMAGRRWAAFLASVLFGALFAKIYAYGYEEGKAPLGQGLRYGMMLGVLAASNCLIQYMVYPVSLKLAEAWAAGMVGECLILGAIVASIYKPEPA